MSEVKLCPNDRIGIGPSALFIYKNRSHEDEASIPDLEEDPISFDFAAEECIEADNQGQKEEKEMIKKAQEEANKKAMEELTKNLDEEHRLNQEKLDQL